MRPSTQASTPNSVVPVGPPTPALPTGPQPKPKPKRSAYAHLTRVLGGIASVCALLLAIVACVCAGHRLYLWGFPQ